MRHTLLVAQLHAAHGRMTVAADALDLDTMADALTQYTATVNSLMVEVTWERDQRPLIEVARLRKEEAANPDD